MIRCNQVTKIYPNGTKALDKVCLTIHPGEFVAVVGLSGAGKSTLLRTINKLVEATGGEIMIEGQSITKAKGKELHLIRRNIGMIFQNFNLINRSSVLRNVLTGRLGYNATFRTLLGFFPKADLELAYQALEQVKLLDKAYVRADQLSGGQQQRVAIARTSAQQAKIILADEPVASLDPLTTHQVMKDLKRINQNLGTTIIANLHSVALAREYATRIIGLNAGKLVFDGAVQQADDAAFAKIYEQGMSSIVRGDLGIDQKAVTKTG